MRIDLVGLIVHGLLPQLSQLIVKYSGTVTYPISATRCSHQQTDCHDAHSAFRLRFTHAVPLAPAAHRTSSPESELLYLLPLQLKYQSAYQ